MKATRDWVSGWFTMRLSSGHFLLAVFFGVSFAQAGEMEFESSGGTFFQYYLTQDNRFNQSPVLPPGYRFAFSIDNLVYRNSIGHFFINAADATIISRSDTSIIKLDKIRYRIEPGFRAIGYRHESNILLSHECIHQIDRPRAGGSIFWNSIQANYGTKGAYDYNMVERVVQRDFQLRNSWDYELMGDAYLFGHSNAFIAQNQDYRGHAGVKLRYNWALWEKSAFYADLTEDEWVTAAGELQNRSMAQINWVLLSQKSVGILYGEYTFRDENPYDNENSLVSIGFRILY